MPSRKWLLPFDGSPSSRKALAYVVAGANDATHVHLLNVQPPTIDDSVYLDPLLELGEQTLREASRRLELHGISHSAEVAVGYPSQAIVARANETACTQIIMGVRSTVARMLTGSVSRDVVRGVDIPVLLVNASGGTVRKCR
jgi:nucleotide-binding universal stress UspA family protein